jgi:hypothetical protein
MSQQLTKAVAYNPKLINAKILVLAQLTLWPCRDVQHEF